MREPIQLPAPPARLHLIGIGGVGVSGLARMLASQGYQVTGSDMNNSPIVEELVLEGIPVHIGHDAANVGDAELIIATAAVGETNPEIAEARRRGITVVKRAAALGMLANPRVCLAVAGSHGKSSTSGMAAFALDAAGLQPSFAVGATVSGLRTNARLGEGPHFVVEADEYDWSFLWLEPSVAIVTNIEHDHPDIFPALDDVIAAFEQFADGIRPGGTLVVSAEDPGAKQLASRDLAGRNIVTFGWQTGDWQIAGYRDGVATVRSPEGQTFELRLSVPGRHNVSNALALLAAVSALEVDPAVVVPHINRFVGVSRRFEVLLDGPERTVVDDYAHHPTEVAATIAAARDRYPGRRILAVFQPHTFSRTHALQTPFAVALDGADEVVLAEIYPARETNEQGIYSADIARQMTTSVQVAGSPEDTASVVRDRSQPGDVLLVMGAGTIYRTARLLAEAYK